MLAIGGSDVFLVCLSNGSRNLKLWNYIGGDFFQIKCTRFVLLTTTSSTDYLHSYRINNNFTVIQLSEFHVYFWLS